VSEDVKAIADRLAAELTEELRAVTGRDDLVVTFDQAPVTGWPRCASCDEAIDSGDPHVLREVRGWARHRDDGGQNHVIDRQETGRLMCGTCGTRLRAKLTPGQTSLM
jgi:hypothetical protein